MMDIKTPVESTEDEFDDDGWVINDADGNDVAAGMNEDCAHHIARLLNAEEKVMEALEWCHSDLDCSVAYGYVPDQRGVDKVLSALAAMKGI